MKDRGLIAPSIFAAKAASVSKMTSQPMACARASALVLPIQVHEGGPNRHALRREEGGGRTAADTKKSTLVIRLNSRSNWLKP